MIQTRWHRALEAIARDDVVVSSAETEAERIDDLPPGVFHRPGLEDAVDLFNSAPKYYFDRKVIDALMSKPEQVHKSLLALSKAGVCKLPFPYLLAEYEWGNAPCLVMFSESQREDCPFRANSMQMMRLSSGDDVLILSPQTLYCSNVFEHNGEPVVNWLVYEAGWINTNAEARAFARKSTAYWQSTVRAGLMAVLLLLNTRGIMRDTIPAPKGLNKARAKKHKPPIPEHTIVRISHVYRRDGTTVSASDHERGKQPLHWRAGYAGTRWITKRHPKWEAERADTFGKHEHLVYVEPYLVNYDPLSEEEPDIPERVVRW